MNQTDVLSDDVLLEIFYFYVDTRPSREGLPSDENKAAIEEWQLLVHVCRRWRSLVLGSPRRLNLRLYCTSKTRIADTLDIWPALPLVVDSGSMMDLSSDTDNLIAALGQSNRICQVDLRLENWNLEEVLAAMQVPFPELTDLRFSSSGNNPPTIPDSFLGGSAPRLQTFKLNSTPFPGLPKLLSSSHHLVELRLINIPHSGYISPEALVTTVCALSGLRILSLDFRFLHPHLPSGLESRSLPIPKRSILPALVEFHFRGVSRYLEDLVILIDTPQLDRMDITFIDPIDLDCPQLAQFINRLSLRVDEARVQYHDYYASIMLLTQYRTTKIVVSCTAGREPGQRLSFITQFCNTPLHPLSAVEGLYLVDWRRHQRLVWNGDAIENALWLRLLLPFTGVKNLYLSQEFAPGIASALEELVGRITEVLPSIQRIFVEWPDPSGPCQESIGKFVAARQLSDHPITISSWTTIEHRD